MKRGFTLVELLAVLVILGVITLVSVPNVINTNKKSVEKDYEEFKKTVENAAEVYVETHPDMKSNNEFTIGITTLEEVGLINKNLISTTKNPETGESPTGCYVQVTKNGNEFTYTFTES